MSKPRRPQRASVVFAAGITFGLLVTGVITALAYGRARDVAADETNRRLVTIGNGIDRQVSGYAETLYGLRSDFGRDPGISRDDFRRLVDMPALTRRNPGAELVAFDRSVPVDQLDAFTTARREDTPGFSPRSLAAQGDHLIVDYMEPWDPKSPAVGLDINSDPTRRRAATFARTSGEVAATEPITLVQGGNQRGFLLMLAAYDTNPLPVTTPARNRHFVGVLVAVFAADTMLQQSGEQRAGLTFSLYDAGPTVDQPRGRARHDDWIAGKPLSRYANYADIDVGSRRWRIVTDDPVPIGWAGPVATAVIGLALTGLISGLFAAMALSRRRAVRLAEQMTEDLRISERQLKEASAAMRGFVDVAAHDLRAPATTIAGFASLLSDYDTLDADERQRALRAIDRQSGRMVSLVEDLLTLSSIDGGALRVQPQTLAVSDVIAECLDEVGPDVDVHIECPPDAIVHADPGHIQRMLGNYVHNAVKYGNPPLRIEVAGSDGMVEIAVADSGPGVPAEFVPRLFGKFARADAELNPQRGTGLGLSIVRGLAEANGGEALYRANTPSGSRFVLRLPTS